MKTQKARLTLTTFALMILMQSCSPKQLCDSQSWSDLNRSTVVSYEVPYVLRYDEEVWDYGRNSTTTSKHFYSKDGSVEAHIWSCEEEKNFTQKAMEERFKSLVASSFGEQESIQISPITKVDVNGIPFFHHVVSKTQGMKYQELVEYVYSGDEGYLSLVFRIYTKDPEIRDGLVSNLLRGISFDGSACRGPRLFRAAKSALEIFGSQSPEQADNRKGGVIRIHKG